MSNTYKIPPPWLIDIPPCNTSLTNFPKDDTPTSLLLQKYSEIKAEYTGYNVLYTDASKTPGDERVGAAVIFNESSHSFSLPPSCSIYTGELYAIAEAIDLSTDINDKNSVIFTDSLSSIHGIKQVYPKHPLLRRIKAKLHELQSENRTVELVWIPSHIGITGNEKADTVAKNSSINPLSTIVTKIPHMDMKSKIVGYTRNLWGNRWRGNANNKLFQLNPNLNPTQYLGIPRKQQVIISRLRIGHTRLTHQHLIKKEPPSMCSTCQTQLSVKHILIECPSYHQQREAADLPSDLQTILCQNNITRLLTFLKLINVFNKI